METLTDVFKQQQALEDLLKLESCPEDLKNNDFGKRVNKYLKRRRFVLNCFAKTINKVDRVRS